MFCPEFLVYKKWLHKKVKINVKIYDVTDWTTNNCNAYFLKYLQQ